MMWILTVKRTIDILLDGTKLADDDPLTLDEE